jgi:hypothetical protein
MIQIDIKSARIKQFGLAVCLLISLFASSISACTCSHHPENFETEVSSGHEHSETAQTERRHEAESNENAQSLVPQDECCCIEPSPKISAKSETLKIEKQSLAVLPVSIAQTALAAQTVSFKSEFAAPFYLTDSFYNLTPGRAPPTL